MKAIAGVVLESDNCCYLLLFVDIRTSEKAIHPNLLRKLLNYLST